jgi:hypothetical protein
MGEQYRPNDPTGFNVVLVTFDGLRWQELFEGGDPQLTNNPGPLFPLFWEKVAPRGVVYGNPRAHSTVGVVTPSNASLPGYMSIFAETEQGCLTNFCGRIEVPTFVDRLKDELGIPKDQIAVFASWSKLRLAVSARDDVAVVLSGVYDGVELTQHPEHALLEGALDFDRRPMLDGFHYLATVRPRFLHLAFLDSDRFGHRDNYQRYLAVLAAYDRLLLELVERLDQSGAYGRQTALVITTDHGRGQGSNWGQHGPQVPESARVWAFVMLPAESHDFQLVLPTERPFTHHDVRYTIESLFGLGTNELTSTGTGFVRAVAGPNVDPRPVLRRLQPSR